MSHQPNTPPLSFQEQHKGRHTEPINGHQTGPTVTDIAQHIERAADRQTSQPINPDQTVGLFRSMSLNQWIQEAKTQPIPARLYGDFWFEGEICFMFAETNQGKSVAAVQIGDSISKGKPIPGFPLEAPAQLVIIFDFELVAKQLEKRYSYNYTDHYQWSENFIRVELNPGADLPNGLTFEEYIIESIEELIQQTGAKVIILDNLTFLRADTESAKDAAPVDENAFSPQTQTRAEYAYCRPHPKTGFVKTLDQKRSARQFPVGSVRRFHVCYRR